MAETHLISGLVAKRAETAGEIAKAIRALEALRADLAAIDRVLVIVGYDASPDSIKPVERRIARGRRGSSSNAILDLLREADKPMSSGDIARALGGADTDQASFIVTKKAVRLTLGRLRQKGLLERVGDGVGTVWKVAE
jgi:hypothetical protein